METMTTNCQVSIDPAQIQATLESVGYKLLDFGNHWRTSALYRGGDNQTSIRIYKNTGVWTDFVQGNKSLPFERLLQLTLNNDQKKLKDIMASLKKSDEFVYTKKETIEMEEIYPEEMLKKLFPNFNFYTKKGFSEETLKFYKTGLAGAGKMYRRMVFPIYNEHQQIIGFSQDLTFQSYRSNGLGGIAVNVLVIECMLGLIMDAQESQRLHVSTNYKP